MRKNNKENNHSVGFEFGKNWKRFLSLLDEERIAAAEESFKTMLGINDLKGKSLLDIGSGSGLFSLAARRLGARVHSFDCDLESAACTAELKERYFPEDENWIVESGSALDRAYLASLGQFDVVYSWGVLHHTGAMWEALENVAMLVRDGGRLFISIYNDQGGASRRWRTVKKFYNRSGRIMKALISISVFLFFEVRSALIKIVRFQNPLPFRVWRDRKKRRGMSVWIDAVDWAGGYPFEVAKPEDIFKFYFHRKFMLTGLKTCAGSLGCNEFVFVKLTNTV